MAEPTAAGVASLADDLRHSWSDVSEMIALRRQLAEAELKSDIALARRFSIFAAAAIAVAVAGLAVLVVAVSSHFDAALAHSFPWITTVTGAAFLLGGALAAAIAWRRFRGRLLLFEHSRAELQEDLLWFEEWLGRPS
jgi:uncharacterized membrane protein YqjE